MRYLFSLACVGVAVITIFFALRPGLAEPTAKNEDPWVGTYSWFGAADGSADGSARAPRITITKEGDGYKLSKPFDRHEFRELKKGVLAADKGALGWVYLGSMEFSNDVRRAGP